MNIFNKVALQGLSKNPARTLVTILGVILSTALFTAVTTFVISLQTYMVNGSTVRYGDWHVDVFDVTKDFLTEEASDSEVGSLYWYENIGYSPLENAKNEAKPYLFIAAFNENTADSVPIQIYSGRMPENDSEIVIPAHIQTDGGGEYTIGDEITLKVGDRLMGDQVLNQHTPYQGKGERLVTTSARTYTVVGICQRPTIEDRSAPGYTLITKASPTPFTDHYTAYIKLKSPIRVRAFLRKIQKKHICDINNEVLRFLGLSNDKIFNSLLYSLGGILMALVMVGSVFLIYNAFNISLNERTHQFGILMSVGATKKQLRNSVLFEGLCIGVIGIPPGMLLGLPGIALILALVSRNFANVLYDSVPLRTVISPLSLVAAASISLVTIIISAWIPARKAASVPVMECIRQTNEIQVDARPVRASSAAHSCGLNGWLAIKNFKRNKRRCRSITLSLALSVILTVAASSFGQDMKAASERAIVFTTYDIAVSMPDADDEEVAALYARLRGTAGVTGGNYQLVAHYIARMDSDKLTSSYWETTGKSPTEDPEEILVEVHFMDDDSYLENVRTLGLRSSEYAPGSDRMIGLAVLTEQTGTQQELEDFSELLTVSSVTAPLYPCRDGKLTDGSAVPVHLDMAKFVPEDTPPVTKAANLPYTFVIIAPWSSKGRFPDTEIIAKGLTFKSDNPGLSTTRMQELLDGIGATSHYVVLNVHSMLEQSRNIMFIANLFSIIFIAMITLIAIVNVYNTVSTNLKLRRRELAMLRSIGMSDRDFNAMLRAECMLYSIKTLLWGLPVSAILSHLIYGAFGRGEIPYTFPWPSMLLSTVGVVIIVSATTFSVIKQLMRENIIDAMRDNMT